MEVEFFFKSLLGGNTSYGHAGTVTSKYWIKDCRRLIEELEKYIEANVNTDKNHLNEIRYQIVVMKGTLRGKSSLDREPILITALAKLCLLLLGDRPKHLRKKRVNKPEFYILQNVRTLQYHQTPKQKAIVIKRECTTGNTQKLEGEEIKNLERRLKSLSSIEFVNWFKGDYPNIYAELF